MNSGRVAGEICQLANPEVSFVGKYLDFINEQVSQSCTERTSAAPKVRLCFSGGWHIPVNMTDSMENAGSSTESKEAMEVPKNFKDLQKLGLWNVVQYSTANFSRMQIHAFFPTYIHFFRTICHVYRSMWPTGEAKPRFAAALVHSVHDCETGLLACAIKLFFLHACLFFSMAAKTKGVSQWWYFSFFAFRFLLLCWSCYVMYLLDGKSPHFP